MRCETCDYLLDADDNYCRKCGAAVHVETMSVVNQAAQPPALFRSTAAPLATGAAAVAATALLRWVIGQAVRGLLSDDRPPRDPSRSRALSRRDAPPEAVASGQSAQETVEIFWYRRTGRG
jgi:hypothetical protein